MRFPFRIRRVSGTARWVPAHPYIQCDQVYVEDHENMPFSVIRAALFAAADRRWPDTFVLEQTSETFAIEPLTQSVEAAYAVVFADLRSRGVVRAVFETDHDALNDVAAFYEITLETTWFSETAITPSDAVRFLADSERKRQDDNAR